MKIASKSLFTAALISASVALGGCGGPLLVGTWAASDGTVLTFNADNTFRTEKVSTMYPGYSGCSVRVVLAGTYSSTGNTLRMSASSAGTGRSGCTNESDNLAYSEGPTGADLTITYTFTLTGTQLTLTPPDGAASMYTMR